MKLKTPGEKRFALFMALPSAAVILVVSIYPLIRGVVLSFQNYSFRRVKDLSFVGFEHYEKLIFTDKQFYAVLGFTLVYALAVVIVSYVFGFFLALLLNRKLFARGAFRAVALIPWVIPPVVAGISWAWVLNPDFGFINTALKTLGVIDSPILFLAKADLAKLTVIGTGAWKSYPFMMVMILATLQNIPDELYESASIDGAGPVQSFWRITLPMVRQVSVVTCMLMFIWTFNNFENIYLLAKGGPAESTQVLSIYIYNSAFYRGNISYASAISSFMVVLLVVCCLFFLRVTGRSGNDE